MLGLILLGVLGVIVLIVGSLLALFLIPLVFLLIPGIFVGIIALAVSSIRWIAGLIWFIVTGITSILLPILQGLF